MTAPANRWKLGLFVVGGLAATITGLVYVGMNELKRDFHVAYAYFDEALTGLEEGSPVKFRGVTIGGVRQIRVAPDKKHLRIEMALFDDYLRDLGLDVAADESLPLPDNLRAQVVMSWVTSTSFVQVDFFRDPARGPQQLPFSVPDDQPTLRTVPSTAKSLEDASREVLRELPLIASTGRELVELLRTELQNARLPEISRQLQAALQRFDATLGELHDSGLIGAAKQAVGSVQAAADSVRDDSSPIGVTLGQLRGTLDSLRREIEAARLADTTGAVRQATTAVGEFGTGLQAELAQLRATLAAVERLATLLERDPGALLHGRGPSRSPLQEGSR